MRIVVYTAIIGKYDALNTPIVTPNGVDFVCFTDRVDVKSDIWDIRKVTPLYDDNTRTARKYKLLPHRWFSDYDVSIWLDGNKIIKGNVTEYITQMGQNNIALFDHMGCFDKRNCVYQEAQAILDLGRNSYQRTPNRGINNWKDTPQIIVDQMNRYVEDGYPQNNGLAFTCGIVRNHNNPNVIRTMEDWWVEIKYGSKRDQLSFDYVAWKNKLPFSYLKGDGRDDGIITHTSHFGKK